MRNLKEKDEIFKIKLEHYDLKISIKREIPEISLEELYDIFRVLTLMMGYPEEIWQKMIDDNFSGRNEDPE